MGKVRVWSQTNLVNCPTSIWPPNMEDISTEHHHIINNLNERWFDVLVLVEAKAVPSVVDEKSR